MEIVRWEKTGSFSFTANIWCLLCGWTIAALLLRNNFQLSTYNAYGPLKKSKILQYPVIKWDMTPNSWGNLWPEQTPFSPAARTELDWWFVLPPPAPWELQAHPLGAEGYLPNSKAGIIIQWLKFKNFPLKLLTSLRSAFRYVTSTLLHPLSTPGCSCLGFKTHRSGLVTAGWGSTTALTPAGVAKCYYNTNKDLVLGSCWN